MVQLLCGQFSGAFVNNTSHILRIPGDQKTFVFFFVCLCVRVWLLIGTAETYAAICDGTTSDNDQFGAQIFNTFITVPYMYMFRAISCSSSGGQIVLIQHLVSSLSVSDRPLYSTGSSGSGWNCRSILILLDSCQQTCMAYTIAVYSEKLLIMDRGTAVPS